MKPKFIMPNSQLFKDKQNREIENSKQKMSLEKKILQDIDGDNIYESKEFNNFLLEINNIVFRPIDQMTAGEKMIVRDIMEMFSMAYQDEENSVMGDKNGYEEQLEKLKLFLREVNQREIDYESADDNIDNKIEQIKSESDETKKNILKQELAKLLTADLAPAFRRKIDQSVLIDILKNRTKQVEKKQEALLEIVRKEKNNFINTIKVAVQNNLLPEGALMSLDKIDAIRVVVFDELASLGESFTYNGRCSEFGGVIEINSSMMQSEYSKLLRHVLSHEFIHAIGDNIANVYLDEYGIEEVKFIKHGLKLKSSVSSRVYGRWLDEGSVERLNVKLFGDIDISNDEKIFFQSYTEEMGVIESFVRQGLDEKLLWEAMFEVHQDKPSKGIGRKMVKLIREIDRINGAGTFAKLNNEDSMNLIVIPAMQSTQTYPIDNNPLSTLENKKRIEFDIVVGKNKAKISRRFVHYSQEDEFEFNVLVHGLQKELMIKLENISDEN